ncbi:MAG: 4-hydroxy-tetrahydrodipicolinate reductase, partial [Chloroflexia bacterium]
MAIKICVAGATGWAGSAVVRGILGSSEYELVGVIARQEVGKDIGEALGVGTAGVLIVATLEELAEKPDVLIDYTKPDSVKARTAEALERGIRVVIGTSGLTAEDYREIDAQARRLGLGVIAAGNFSITAALAKHFALVAAKYVPSWEIIDYAHADKIDSPSGTTRELAEELAEIAQNKLEVPIEET